MSINISNRRIIMTQALATGGSVSVIPSTSGTPAAQANAYAAGTLTFSNLNGGTNFPTCKVVILVGTGDGVTGPVSPKVGATAATLITSISNGSGSNFVFMYYADVAAGTADNFNFTNGSDFNHIAVLGWQLAGAAAGGPSSFVASGNYGSFATPFSYPAITVPTGGLALFGAYHFGGGSITPTWTNTTSGTGDNVTSNANLEVLGAHCIATGSQVASVDGTGFSFALGGIASAWGP